MEVGVQGLPLFIAGKPMPSSHEPSNQWNQAPVTLIYQGKIKRGGVARGGGERTIQKTNESETNQKHFPDLGGDHYVISLLLSQMSSRWETNGRVPKCRLFSQVILTVECTVQQIRLSLLIVLLFTNKVSLSFQVFAD